MRSATNVDSISQNFHETLKACLDALYPNRQQWGNKPKTNATGIKELHIFLIDKPEYLTLNQIKEIYDIINKRLDKKSCCGCWPCHFTKRDPFVESLYLALNKLDAKNNPLANIDNIRKATDALKGILNNIKQHKIAKLETTALPTEYSKLIK